MLGLFQNQELYELENIKFLCFQKIRCFDATLAFRFN